MSLLPGPAFTYRLIAAAPIRGPIGQFVEFVVGALIWGVIEPFLAFQRH